MMIGMTKAKIAITIDEDLLTEIRARVAGGASGSVSGFIERAVATSLDAEAEFDRLVDDVLEASGGPASPEELARARRVIAGEVDEEWMKGPRTAR
jgi:hypothetical protein